MGSQIVSTPTEIQKNLRQIRPVRVAVAFVGENWESYVNANDLSEIVISPTIGSNPRAIEDISTKIGWDRVHFLDNLHSKIYIGDRSALMGSCNLSDNGIGEGGLEETAIFLQDKNHVAQLNKLIDGYIEMAKQMYPTEERKKLRLSELIQQRKEMPRYCPPGEYGKTAPEITSYVYSPNHRIHIAYYVGGKIHLNEKLIRGQADVPTSQKIEDYFYDYLEFTNEDLVKKGDWILCWKVSKDDLPSGQVNWMYVDEVIKDGVEDKQYSMLVGQVKKNMPTPPFNLDSKLAKKKICNVLAREEFKMLRPYAEDATWKLKPADELVPQFIEAVKIDSGS